MNVLMIAYEFPPGAAGGVMRTAKFCKYLQPHGCRPHVLTPVNSSLESTDPSLLHDLGPQTTIHRCRGLEYERSLKRLRERRPVNRFWQGLEWRLRRMLEHFAIPDAKSYWAIPAIFAGLRICRRSKIDAIFSTSWPFSDHLAGLWLHRLTGLPWIADFRDPWMDHYNYGPKGTRRDRLNRKLEMQICRKAVFVISTTASATQALRRSHVDLPSSKFVTIRNGYDPADFVRDTKIDHDFSIVHAGTFYGSRNPDSFWAGVRRFLDRRPDARARLRVTMIGATLDGAATPPFEGIPWVSHPWFSHRQTVRVLQESQVLLLVQHRESAVSLTVPGKLFEYMATGRHILSLNTQPGETLGLLRGYGNATILHDDEPAHVSAALEAMYRQYLANRLQCPTRLRFVERFSRIESARQLAGLFRRATAVPFEKSTKVVNGAAINAPNESAATEAAPCVC